MSSVPSEARKQSQFEPIIKARSLCNYTLKILKNNKNFKAMPTGNPEDDLKNPPQPELVERIRNTVIDMYIAAFTANDTKFVKENYKFRRQLQDKAISKCNELLALVELSMSVFHLRYKRIEYWSKEILLVRNLINSWMKSDYKRYKKL